jgi:YbbR domain-containing protein
MKKLIGIITLFTTVLTLCGDEQLLQIGKAQSKVEVVVNVTAHTFVASLENYDLKITVDTERAKIINTEFSFDFKELKTGKKARDKEMLKWEEYNKYPNCFLF